MRFGPRNLECERPAPARLAVLVALSLLAMTAYLMRACIAAAATTIQEELHLTSPQLGDVMAAFSIGYLVFQVPGGWLGDRWGNRFALPLLSLLASLATLWSALAATAAALWISRLGLGLAQAGMIPCAATVLKDWFPQAQRGLASAVFASSMSVGAVLAAGLTAVLMPYVGWRAVFAFYAGLGALWAITFLVWFRDRRPDDSGTKGPERESVAAGAAAAAPSAEPETAAQRARRDQTASGEPGEAGCPAGALSPDSAGGAAWRAMISSPSMWAICGQSFFRAFGYIFFVTWFPAYLEKGYGVTSVSAGLLTMVPLGGVVAGSLLGGTLVDALWRATGSKRISRSGTGTAALALCAVATLAASGVHDPDSAVLLISFGTFFSGLGGPAAWTATMDISGRHNSVVFGIMNMCGVLGAIASPMILGHLFAFIQQTGGDWNWILYLFTANYAAGALCWAVLDPNCSAVERRPR